MAQANRFAYRSLDELTDDISRRGLDLPASDDVSILAEPVAFGRLTVPNRLAVQPMEGCDASADGAPGELAVRRYKRFAGGGAGLIWFEACAVVGEGRANPRQLWLHEGTVEAFAAMVAQARQAAADAVGHRPVLVLQLTHSGRYSRPGAAPAPIIAHHSPVLDGTHSLPADYPLITDEQLDALQEAFVRAALLAAEAGFDAVDIKSCHRYLLSELLASFTRRDSRYGGSFENRTRMLRETAGKVRDAVGDRLEVTCRMNVYDAIAHPYGWGVAPGEQPNPDLAEPIRLVGELAAQGFGGVNVSAGNPYFNPYVNRPADWMIANWPDAPEHPLDGVARLAHMVRDVQLAHPDTTVVGSGLTWLRHYMPQFAAGMIQRGWMSIVGLGRGALAYPDFARDLLGGGGMDRHKVCVACSSCTQMMRDGQVSGCVVRDHTIYAPIFRRGRHSDADVLGEMASRCRRCTDPMCMTQCPAGVDIPGFLSALADGDPRRAYQTLRESNCLPGICGAVCPVEVQCQSACIQGHIGDGPVAIGEIQRILSARATKAGWAAIDVPAEPSGRSVAIVGAGPAGLAAAEGLLAKGHRVVLFDRATRRGGNVGGVIPPSRLPAAEADAEIAALFDGVGPDRLEWRLGRPLGPGLTLDQLCGEGYDAVVLAMGLGSGAALAEDRRPAEVLEAGAFLRQINEHPDYAVPAGVAVIGGGNTALDAAVCAATRGATDVYVIYRRSYAQMPAWPGERDDALHAGVHLLLLCQPTGYVCDGGGRLAGVRIVRTRLGEPDAGGRRRPEQLPDSEFVLPVQLVVEALGERMEPALSEVLAGVEITGDGLVAVDVESLATTRAGVWAAGDLVRGPATVVQAVADGRRVADTIDVHLAAAKL